jgi:hypothetical protein
MAPVVALLAMQLSHRAPIKVVDPGFQAGRGRLRSGQKADTSAHSVSTYSVLACREGAAAEETRYADALRGAPGK